MPEDGLATLLDFSEKFTEIGGADLPCILKMRYPPGNIMGNPVDDELILDWQDVTMVLVNETLATQELISKGESLLERHVFTVWGGVLDKETDDDGNENPFGRSSIIVPKLRAAMNSGAGFLYGDELFAIEKFKRGLIVGGIVLEWFLICSGKGFDSI